jgi:hypothetical protein
MPKAGPHGQPFRTDEEVEAALIASRGDVVGACKILNLVSPQSLRTRIYHNPELNQIREDAKALEIFEVKSALVKAALDGDVQAQKIYLYNKGKSDGWGQESTINVNTNESIDLSLLETEELLEYERLKAKSTRRRDSDPDSTGTG